MPEASVNDAGNSPGRLKLRDVTCVRQNDQLRSLYGLVHAVGCPVGISPSRSPQTIVVGASIRGR
jgi:hypothetical protein